MRLLGHNRIGSQQEPSHTNRVLQCRPHHFGRVDDAGLNQVFVNTFIGIETKATLALADLMHYHIAFLPGIVSNLPERHLQSIVNDLSPGLLIAACLDLQSRFPAANQRDATARHNAFFDRRSR